MMMMMELRTFVVIARFHNFLGVVRVFPCMTYMVRGAVGCGLNEMRFMFG